MSLKFRIVLSLACAALALVSFWSYGSTVRAEADQVRQEALERYGGEVVQLVVANRDLAAGEQLGTADVSQVDWLVDLAPEDGMATLDQVVGRIVTVPVAKGAPLCGLNFREDAPGMEVPEGRVAVSLGMSDRSGIPREARAGSVMAAYAVGDVDVRLVSADLVVLSVSGTSRGDSALSVAVRPEEVTAVLLASARGSLRLVLPAQGMPSLGDTGPESVEEAGAGDGEVAPGSTDVEPADVEADDAGSEGAPVQRNEEGEVA